jgi:DNA-binding NarL/FixJ family response regulator
MATDTIHVAVVEDDPATREGLGQLIAGSSGFRCTGCFRSVEDALPRLDPQTQILLLDIHLPGMPGSEGVKVLREKYPGLQVVILTVFDEAEHVFESICNGACGYLLKRTAPARLLEAIKEANQGGAPMTPEIARQVIDLFCHSQPSRRTVDHRLSPRELEVLTLLAEGYAYTNLAAQLEISVNTVRNHIRAIYEKLHVHSRTEAVSKALRRRFI